jgi:hypothetical protein
LKKRIDQKEHQRSGDNQLIWPEIGEKTPHQARVISFAKYLFFQLAALLITD